MISLIFLSFIFNVFSKQSIIHVWIIVNGKTKEALAKTYIINAGFDINFIIKYCLFLLFFYLFPHFNDNIENFDISSSWNLFLENNLLEKDFLSKKKEINK